MKTNVFFNDEFSQFSLYDTYRSCAAYVDGLKPSQRKVVHGVMMLELNNKSLKVSQLGSKVAELTQYLHGERSLESVIVNMACDYVGTNNINILAPEGHFGTRFIQEPSASRYIFTKKMNIFDSIFNDTDNDILEHQTFEGESIEPKYFLPTIPFLLINGSEGIGSGYAQKILPRDPKAIINVLKKSLIDINSVSKDDLIKFTVPYFKGFKGTITQGENKKSWIILGKFVRKTDVKITITELPIGYDLQSYIKVLDKLEESNIIKSYKDLSQSETDTFIFDVTLTQETSKQTDKMLYETLHLYKKVTENYTCIDENNKVIEFKSPLTLFSTFFKFRLKKYEERKNVLLEKLKKLIPILENKERFIREILDGNIVFNKKPIDVLIKELEDKNYLKIEDSFNYLLNMSINTLTEDRYNNIIKQLEQKREEYATLEKTNINEIWLKDVELLESKIDSIL